jgi:energy-coupling factor transporter ATP-binding protein EcfA2
MIQIDAFSYNYPGTVRPALQEISLTIPKGQFCGIIGANGSGKSTLCYVISGFIPHFFQGTWQGTATLSGLSISAVALSELIEAVGLVSQNPFNQITGARLTVFEEVAFGLENLGVARHEIIRRVNEALCITNLSDLKDRSPYELSGGQQQRLAIASLIAMKPQILVLDEPTTQLDPAGTRDVFEALHDLTGTADLTVVLTGHTLSWIGAYADRVIALDEGRVVADGPPRAVLTSPKLEKTQIGYTRYTQAAKKCVERRLCDPHQEFPVTLKQSVEFFS